MRRLRSSASGMSRPPSRSSDGPQRGQRQLSDGPLFIWRIGCGTSAEPKGDTDSEWVREIEKNIYGNTYVHSESANTWGCKHYFFQHTDDVNLKSSLLISEIGKWLGLSSSSVIFTVVIFFLFFIKNENPVKVAQVPAAHCYLGWVMSQVFYLTVVIVSNSKWWWQNHSHYDRWKTSQIWLASQNL